MVDFARLAREAGRLSPVRRGGAISMVRDQTVRVSGLDGRARVGDQIRFAGGGVETPGEIIGLDDSGATAMAFAPLDGAALGDPAWIAPDPAPRPSDDWLGHVLDAWGRPVTGVFDPAPGPARALRAAPTSSMARRAVGARMASGHAAFDTLLPICRGQRIGLFAGSGVGKSRLLAALAQRMETEVAVIGLIGERGREVREFVERTLGAEAMKRCVVIVATSDEPPAVKRRAAWLTMTVAEHFRDRGRQVLLLLDSLTRFAEAHREVALTSGETASLGGFPPSTANLIAGLAERAGPGLDRVGVGDITAVFSVLVAGSDMEEPVADMTRGILDGHIVLDREIAERGRFPAIDVRRSVSRMLPDCASEMENALISRARRVLATYEQAEAMIQIGLYQSGADRDIDEAKRIWPELDKFFAAPSERPGDAFERLAAVLAGAG